MFIPSALPLRSLFSFSHSYVYPGNYWDWYFNTTGNFTFDVNDYAQNNNNFFWNYYDGRTPAYNGADCGDNASPVKVSQTAALKAGNRYRLQFWTGNVDGDR